MHNSWREEPSPGSWLGLMEVNMLQGAGMEEVAPNEVPPGFHKVELNKTVWVVPDRYQNLTPIGTGAYGSVWFKASRTRPSLALL